jgi:Uma2 family endonuclease
MHLLSSEELRRIYPESDGKPMAENTLQFEWIALIKLNLEAYFAQMEQVFVAADLFWYPVEGQPGIRMAPDVMVALGRPAGHRGSYLQFMEDNIAPQVVFEILSPGNRKAEMTRKLNFYSNYGVKEYYLYNPHHNKLEIYTRTRNELRLREEVRQWTSPLLKVKFVWTSETLELYKPNGEPFLSYLELTEFHAKAVEALQESRALLQQERKQLDQERAQVERERQRAEQEKQRATRAEQRLRTSIQTLTQAGIPPSEIMRLLGLSEEELAQYS